MDTPPSFYSQHGEDVIAWKVFSRSREPRYFVEVGVIDGRRFSNTLALEQRGWRGLCVEAHPQFAELCRRNRPGSTVIHAAATDRCGTLALYADPRGDLSSILPRDPEQMQRRFGAAFRGYERVDVPARTLNDMLYQADVPRGLEVLSIDVEGAEIPALRGLDFNYWRPRMVIVEADDADALHALRRLMQRRGYRFVRQVGVNAVFCRTARDAVRIRLARVDRRVLHTGNPMDDDAADQLVLPSGYETCAQYLRRFGRRAA